LIPDQLNISARERDVSQARTRRRRSALDRTFTDWLGTARSSRPCVLTACTAQANVLIRHFDPGTSGVTPPANRYQLDPHYSRRPDGEAIDRTFGRACASARPIRIAMDRSCAATISTRPHGVRPDPSLANVVDVVGDAASV
jgi:hypothetical protein